MTKPRKLAADLARAVADWQAVPPWAKSWIVSGLSVESDYWTRGRLPKVCGTWKARGVALRLLRAAGRKK